MSYSPPAGNAVEFQFDATPYVAPTGGAITFSFLDVFSAEVVATLLFEGTVSSAHGVTANVLCRDFLSVSGEAQLPISSVFASEVRFYVAVTAEQAPLAYANAEITFSADGVAVGHVSASVAAEISFASSATSIATAYGEAYSILRFSASIDAVAVPQATAYSELEFSATGSGFVSPVLVCAPRLRFSGQGSGHVGTAALASARIPFACSAQARRGHTGQGASRIAFRADSVARRGTASQLAATLQFSASATSVSVPAFSAAFHANVPFVANGVGGAPVQDVAQTITVRRVAHEMTVMN